MKYLIVFLFLFVGCGGSKYFYWDVNFSVKAKKEAALEFSFPDYMKSGYVAAKDGDEFVYLNKEVPESVEKFYGGYLIKYLKKYGIEAKIYPWDFKIKPKKIYFVKIDDYFVDLKNKEAILRGECCGRYFEFRQKYKNDWMMAYKKVFNQFAKKIGGMI